MRAEIIHQIVNAEPPKVIAIDGTWGSGKTSLLAQIYSRLGGKVEDIADGELAETEKKDYSDQLKVVWFEAWQYQHEPNILAALLKEIREQLSSGHKFWNEVGEKSIPAVVSILQSIDLSFKQFGVEFGFKGWGDKYAKNVKEYQKERFSTPLDTVMLKKMLRQGINQLLLPAKLIGVQLDDDVKRKAIIFIDDLDRCEPEVTHRILEAIKVYLNLDNCVFVLGMDTKIVEEIIAKNYESQIDQTDENIQKKLKNRARLYLEKICQDIYHLPVPTPEDRNKYFETLLYKSMDESNPLAQRIVALAKEYNFLPPIPRSIKILANVFITHANRTAVQSLNLEEDNGFNVKAFIILSYLYAYHFEIYQLCYLYDNQDFYNQTFLMFCTDPNTFKSSQGIHPVLESLILPIQSSSEALEGATADEIIQRTFPHESLRQVLWIRRMIIETRSIPREKLLALKF